MINIAVFASGSGTNAENLIKHFQNSDIARVVLVLSDKKDAYVLTRAKNLNIPSATFTYKELKDNSITVCGKPYSFLSLLQEYNISLILLAGFLLKIPDYLLEQYPKRIINIHPALLPKYGGKGMFGEHVHQAVIAAHEKESGITIHLVDNQYDHGAPLFQTKCTISEHDTPEALAAKIHELERNYPAVVEKYIMDSSF